jgi:hypothetical protein
VGSNPATPFGGKPVGLPPHPTGLSVQSHMAVRRASGSSPAASAYRQQGRGLVRGADVDGRCRVPAAGERGAGLPEFLFPSGSERASNSLPPAGRSIRNQSRLISAMPPVTNYRQTDGLQLQLRYLWACLVLTPLATRREQPITPRVPITRSTRVEGSGTLRADATLKRLLGSLAAATFANANW